MFQNHVRIRHIDAHGVGGRFRGADAGEDPLDLGKTGDDPLADCLLPERLFESDTVLTYDIDAHVPLVQGRYEIRAGAVKYDRRRRHDDKRARDQRRPSAQTETEDRVVRAPNNPEKERVRFSVILFSRRVIRHDRHERERHGQARAQRHEYGKRHGAEHLSFDPFEGEYGHIHDHDDGEPEQDGFGHLRA